nr:hypothetical protein [uncultured Anaerocolumna sp.]
MAKRYIRINFQNAPSTATPLSAEILNKMDKGIDDIDNAVELKIDKTSIIQTTATNDSTKVPSSAVTYGLQQSVNEINNNLTWKVVASVSGNTKITLPNNYQEILIGINMGQYFNSTSHVSNLWLGQDAFDLKVGSTNAEFTYNISKISLTLTRAIIENNDYTPATITTVYYR